MQLIGKSTNRIIIIPLLLSSNTLPSSLVITKRNQTTATRRAIVITAFAFVVVPLSQQNHKRWLSFYNNNKMTTMMKSIVYGPNNEPIWKEMKRPTLIRNKKKKINEVVVQILAVGLNPVDAKGVIGDKLPHTWIRLQSFTQRYFVQSKVIGYDFAGIIVETTKDDNKKSIKEDNDYEYSSNYKTGDRVYGILPPSRYGGTLQEYVTVPIDQIAHIPDTVSYIQAAALPLVGITAWQCLHNAKWSTLSENDTDSNNNISNNDSRNDENDNNKDSNSAQDEEKKTLLVIGASGGTGHVAVQIGRAMQPNAKIVALCSERNRSFVQNLDNSKNNTTTTITVLDYRDNNLIQLLQDEGPYDVVMDCVTSGDPRDQDTIDYGKIFKPPLQQNQKSNNHTNLLKPHGQYRRLGGIFIDWVKAGIERITGISLWSNRRYKLFWIQMQAGSVPIILQQIMKWLQDGTIVGTHVSLTVPFTPDGIQQGFNALQGRRVVGKIVVDMALTTKSTAIQDNDEIGMKNLEK